MTILKTIQTVLKDYTPRLLQDDGSTQGAVIVPLFQREGELFVLLTKRTENLSIHKGQISFPGGKKEPNDKTIFHCALRETLEEVGIPPEKIALLGTLDQLKTFGSNVLLTPFVCEVAFPFELKPNSGEVEEVIEIPFKELLKNENWSQKTIQVDKIKEKIIYYFDYKHWTVWGATAQILHQLVTLVRPVLD
ncbi:MAG: CoA pyrophosphatase [Candidatus Heimdallarchaeota archaeon]|nr:CoA pyrophosphatase [Candidatus Heimdallarchaeota archaeon]